MTFCQQLLIVRGFLVIVLETLHELMAAADYLCIDGLFDIVREKIRMMDGLKEAE